MFRSHKCVGFFTKQRDIVINVKTFPCTVHVILVGFNELKFSGQIFEESSNIKFYQNPSSRRTVVSCRRTDGRTDGRTVMAKLIAAFRNYANAPKNGGL